LKLKYATQNPNLWDPGDAPIMCEQKDAGQKHMLNISQDFFVEKKRRKKLQTKCPINS